MSSDETQKQQTLDRITVQLREERYCDTTVHVAEVTIPDISCLRSAFAQDTYGRNVNETVLAMAQRTGAILAVNGDFYGARRTGYVIRNGEIYRDRPAKNQQDLCIMNDGSFQFVWESSISAQELLQRGAVHVLSFGPALIENGTLCVDENDEVGVHMNSNPRTAVAMLSPLHYLFVVSDGRTEKDAGLTLQQLAGFLLEQGAQDAYNLDGGGSSTLVYQGSVINFATENGAYREREVSDIVYISAE